MNLPTPNNTRKIFRFSPPALLSWYLPDLFSSSRAVNLFHVFSVCIYVQFREDYSADSLCISSPSVSILLIWVTHTVQAEERPSTVCLAHKTSFLSKLSSSVRQSVNVGSPFLSCTLSSTLSVCPRDSIYLFFYSAFLFGD